MNISLLLAALLLHPALAFGFGQTIPGDQRIDGDSWFPIGPAPVTNLIPGQTNSGRATVIAVNPFNAREVWLGTASGGGWHSVDEGASWRPVPVASTDPAPGSLAIASVLETLMAVWVDGLPDQPFARFLMAP